jgi:hypothetical protein
VLPYPDGYRDPQWDGSAEQFAALELPARTAALEQSLNEAFPLPARMRWEWGAA